MLTSASEYIGSIVKMDVVYDEDVEYYIDNNLNPEKMLLI